jgi:hypothetical protein
MPVIARWMPWALMISPGFFNPRRGHSSSSSGNWSRKLVRFHGADLMFTDAAVREIARIALERGTGARGLRSVIEEVLEGVLFDVEAGMRYVISEKTVRGGEAVKQSMSQTRAPLSWHVLRRLAAKNPSC